MSSSNSLEKSVIQNIYLEIHLRAVLLDRQRSRHDAAKDGDAARFVADRVGEVAEDSLGSARAMIENCDQIPLRAARHEQC